ncbi:MAG: hypothetical protein NC111_04950 [Bacteroides sp.]|nr:hypothetical protein [Bacteroides sp.]MCM1413675.1 hypothetical protein [Bacteroides sp.]MCM1471854.1 hypothetical protein [Bacteroides sp.]
MKTYLLKGYAFEASECGIDIIGEIYADRTALNKRIQEIIDETLSYAGMTDLRGCNCSETIKRVNNDITNYICHVTYDLNNEQQRDAYSWSPLVLFAGLSNTEIKLGGEFRASCDNTVTQTITRIQVQEIEI